MKLVQGGIATRAEGREAEGLPVGDTDRVFLQPITVVEVPVGQAVTPSEPPEGDSGGTRSLQWPELKATRAQAALMRQFRRDHARLEALFTAELVKVFDDLGDVAFSAAVRHVKTYEPALVTVGSNGHGSRAKAEPPTPDEIESARLIIETMALDRWAQDRLLPAFEVHYLRTADMTVESINSVINLGVDLPDRVQRQIVAAGGKRMGIVDIVGDTRQAVLRSFAEGRALGEGPPAIARRIRENVPAGRFAKAGPQYRANAIARTETKFARNISSLEAYQASDVVSGMLAFDAQLGATDEDCEARNGQVFSFDEARGLTEAEHPNGTLSWAPSIGG